MKHCPANTKSFSTGGHASPSRRGGFTLLEVILALFLMIMLLSGVFSFYQTVLKTREEGNKIAVDVMRARAVLAKIADEIRHVLPVVPGDGIGFRGTRDSITIVKVKIPENYAFEELSFHEDLPPAQMDMVRITYELVWDEELEDDEGIPACHGLWRSYQKTFDPNPKFVVAEADTPGETMEKDDEEEDRDRVVEGELIAPEIKYLEFSYFDGAEWRDRWHVAYEDGEEEDEEGEEGNSAESGNADNADLDKLTKGLTKTSEPGKAGPSGYVLPQAVKITIGRERVDPEERDNIDWQEQDKEIHHPDRFTIVVYLRQADQSLLSSRMYGVENEPDLQLGGDL